MSTKKYRPYFTLPELEMLESNLPITSQSYKLKQYLAKFISDIRNEYRVPNMTLSPTISDNLGFSSSPSISPQQIYTEYRLKGNGVGMSSQDISIALSYGYQNDLLSEQEDREYEMKLLSKDI